MDPISAAQEVFTPKVVVFAFFMGYLILYNLLTVSKKVTWKSVSSTDKLIFGPIIGLVTYYLLLALVHSWELGVRSVYFTSFNANALFDLVSVCLFVLLCIVALFEHDLRKIVLKGILDSISFIICISILVYVFLTVAAGIVGSYAILGTSLIYVSFFSLYLLIGFLVLTRLGYERVGFADKQNDKWQDKTASWIQKRLDGFIKSDAFKRFKKQYNQYRFWFLVIFLVLLVIFAVCYSVRIIPRASPNNITIQSYVLENQDLVEQTFFALEDYSYSIRFGHTAWIYLPYDYFINESALRYIKHSIGDEYYNNIPINPQTATNTWTNIQDDVFSQLKLDTKSKVVLLQFNKDKLSAGTVEAISLVGVKPIDIIGNRFNISRQTVESTDDSLIISIFVNNTLDKPIEGGDIWYFGYANVRSGLDRCTPRNGTIKIIDPRGTIHNAILNCEEEMSICRVNDPSYAGVKFDIDVERARGFTFRDFSIREPTNSEFTLNFNCSRE